MEFEQLLQLVGDDPVFDSSLLLAGNVNPGYIRQQLTRWIKNGRINQLRRGLYAFAPPYQKVKPHPFVIANRLQRASYVSGQSALAYYGLIPETIYATFSVSTGRPERLNTPLGVFEYRHIKPTLIWGYSMLDLVGQHALVAKPEKALLDLVYLQPAGDSIAYLQELRLQNLDQIMPDTLQMVANKFNSPKVNRATASILNLMQSEMQNYQDFD